MSPSALVPNGLKAVQPARVNSELANKPIRSEFQRLRNRFIRLGSPWSRHRPWPLAMIESLIFKSGPYPGVYPCRACLFQTWAIGLQTS